MEKQTIMVDMDDVLLTGGFLKLLNEFLGTNYEMNDFKNFYMQNIIPKDELHNFFNFFFQKNMYDYCELVPYSYEVLKELQVYYDIYIGTAYLFREDLTRSAIMPYYKHLCLQKHYPFIKPDHYIFINNKGLLQTDVKIDDRDKNLENAKIKLLFTAFHNIYQTKEELDSKGIKRVNNWLEVRERLLER